MSNYIVGLTGGIGSGKTTVSNIFESLGITVVDADIIAREVVARGSEALAAIHLRYGDTILLENGELNRKALREIVFTKSDEKAWLNSLTHPLIRESMLNALANATSDYVILSAPLLFENQLEKIVHSSLVVDVPEATQKHRTSKRDDVAESQVQAIIDSQIDRDKRLSLANDVIENIEPDLTLLEQKVIKLHKKYLSKSKNR